MKKKDINFANSTKNIAIWRSE